MMPGWRVVPGALFGAVAILAIGAASRAPWSATPADRALVRLSWRAPSQVSEECRPLSEAEKAELPVHMRVPEVCERRAVPYSLRVAINGTEILSETIHGAGAREDRAISVFREIPLAAGTYDVRVAFVPVGTGDDAHEEEEEGEEEGEGKEKDDESEENADEEDAAVALEFSDTIRLDDREIALVTLDPGRRSLVLVMPR